MSSGGWLGGSGNSTSEQSAIIGRHKFNRIPYYLNLLFLLIASHYYARYRLWQKMWSVWTEYVQLSRCKRRKRELARNFAKGKLLRNAWRGWSRYILARRGKKEVKAQVEQWSIIRIKRYVSLITVPSCISYACLPNYLPYSQKIWQFGGLYHNRQIKICQNFLLA